MNNKRCLGTMALPSPEDAKRVIDAYNRMLTSGARWGSPANLAARAEFAAVLRSVYPNAAQAGEIEQTRAGVPWGATGETMEPIVRNALAGAAGV